ncbi:hypothetical protein CLOM_g2787 [Closterium sp. NIES-68]|nr:hypothetical protein CLOM_g2787 [Closterium sp. NIES-68]
MARIDHEGYAELAPAAAVAFAGYAETSSSTRRSNTAAVGAHTRSMSVSGGSAAGHDRTPRHEWLMSRYLESEASSSLSSSNLRRSSFRLDLPLTAAASSPASPSPCAAAYSASASPLPPSADRFHYSPSGSYYAASPSPLAPHPAYIPQSKSASVRGNPYAFLHASPFRYSHDCYDSDDEKEGDDSNDGEKNDAVDDGDSGGRVAKGGPIGGERSRSVHSSSSSSSSISGGGGIRIGSSRRSSTVTVTVAVEKNEAETGCHSNVESSLGIANQWSHQYGHATSGMRSAPGPGEAATCPCESGGCHHIDESIQAGDNTQGVRSTSSTTTSSISSRTSSSSQGSAGGRSSSSISRRHGITEAIRAAVLMHSTGGSGSCTGSNSIRASSRRSAAGEAPQEPTDAVRAAVLMRGAGGSSRGSRGSRGNNRASSRGSAAGSTTAACSPADIMHSAGGNSHGNSHGGSSSAEEDPVVTMGSPSNMASVLMEPCDANEAATIENQRLQVTHSTSFKQPCRQPRSSTVPDPTALQPLLGSEIVLDPSKKVQWFGDWDDGRSWKETRSKTHRWKPEDTLAVPGLPGRIPMGKMVEYVWLLLLLAMAVTAGGMTLFSVLFWARGPAAVCLAVMGVLGGRGVLLAGYCLMLRLLLGAERVHAACYALLDITTAGALAALFFLSSSASLTIPIASYLLARSLCELLTLLSAWNCRGREWWTSLLAVWPPLLLGISLFYRQPTGESWYIVTVMGLCCVVEGLPLWVACVVLRVRLVGGRGSLPQHARACVRKAAAVGTFMHGVLRLLLLALFFVAKYAL